MRALKRRNFVLRSRICQALDCICRISQGHGQKGPTGRLPGQLPPMLRTCGRPFRARWGQTRSLSHRLRFWLNGQDRGAAGGDMATIREDRKQRRMGRAEGGGIAEREATGPIDRTARIGQGTDRSLPRRATAGAARHGSRGGEGGGDADTPKHLEDMGARAQEVSGQRQNDFCSVSRGSSRAVFDRRFSDVLFRGFS
jgi:hypothetical protein